MADDNANEVVVIVPEASGDPTANPVDASNPSDPGSVTEEIIDVVLDPLGSSGTSTEGTAAVEEVIVVEPEGVTTDTEVQPAATDTPDQTDSPASEPGYSDPSVTGAGSAEPGEVEAPAGDASPDATGDTSPADPTTGDSTIAGADDTTGGTIGTDTDATATGATSDSTTDATDPDAQSQSDAQSDAQYNLDQAEQSESQAAASGDYSTAQDDATQAYQASEDVANAGGPDNTDTTWSAMQDESWANWDQQTANEDAQSAQSYAEAGDAQGAEVYGDAAQNEQENADNSGAEGEYGGELGPEMDSSTETDTSATVDDESSATS